MMLAVNCWYPPLKSSKYYPVYTSVLGITDNVIIDKLAASRLAFGLVLDSALVPGR